MEKNILYAATRNIYQDTVVSMKSLLYHNKVDRVFLFAEDDTLPYEFPEFVHVINVSDQYKLFEKGVNKNYRLSYVCLMRAIASKFLDVDTVLSVDYDMLIRGDISPLFDLDVSEYFFAGTPEPGKNWSTLPNYVNFGMALLNLRKLREIEDGIVALLNNCQFECGEQDIMNLVCDGRILHFPSIYNSAPWTGKCDEQDIIVKHYCGRNRSGIKEELYKDPDYKRFLTMSWKQVLTGEKNT